MPKVIDTRKLRAAKLLERIERGPSFNPTTGEPLTTEEAQAQYNRWMNSWILEDLKYLIPELRQVQLQEVMPRLKGLIE